MIKNICGQEYFIVPVLCHTAKNKKQEKLLISEVLRAKNQRMKMGTIRILFNAIRKTMYTIILLNNKGV